MDDIVSEIARAKKLLGLIWVTLIITVLVTLIDWKLKQDIITAVKRLENTALEAADNVRKASYEGFPINTVLPVRDLDSDAGVEAEAVVHDIHEPPTPRTNSGNVRRRKAQNPDRLPEAASGPTDSDAAE